MIPYVGFGGPGASVAVSGGAATTTLNGTVYLDVTGFSSDPITSVELLLGDETIYSGDPAVLSLAATYDGSTSSPLQVVARTAGTSVSETYSDVLVTTLSAPFIVRSEAITGTGSVAGSGWLVSQGIPIRESSGNKWRPIRLRSNGSLVYLRRS